MGMLVALPGSFQPTARALCPSHPRMWPGPQWSSLQRPLAGGAPGAGMGGSLDGTAGVPPRGCTRRRGAPFPPSTLCGCDRSPGSGNTPTRSLAGSVSPHSACALAGEKTARVKEKKYFSDSEEETACLGPAAVVSRTPVSGELMLLCAAVCLQLPDSLRSGDSHGEDRRSVPSSCGGRCARNHKEMGPFGRQAHSSISSVNGPLLLGSRGS